MVVVLLFVALLATHALASDIRVIVVSSAGSWESKLPVLVRSTGGGSAALFARPAGEGEFWVRVEVVRFDPENPKLRLYAWSGSWGYRFNHWEVGGRALYENPLELDFAEARAVQAVFAPTLPAVLSAALAFGALGLALALTRKRKW